MLVLSRRKGESVVLPELGIEVTVLETKGNSTRLGITAPKEIQVHRREVADRAKTKAAKAASTPMP